MAAIEDFKKEYIRISPRSAKEYNDKRSPGSPAWQTLSRRCADGTWSGLVLAACVNVRCLRNRSRLEEKPIVIRSVLVSDLRIGELEKQKFAKKV